MKIDLAVGVGMTDDVQTILPATALQLPRLNNSRYRLYPVVDQIADKVCATMFDYNGRQSSREKDLVDIVVLAVTQRIDGSALNLAIETERQRRKMDPIARFVIPKTWGRGYMLQSKPIPHCADYRTVELASGLASHLIDPALTGDACGKTWSDKNRRWL